VPRAYTTAPAIRLDATGAFCILSADPKTEAVQWTVEQRLEQLEKRNKRLMVALTMTVVAMSAVVTVAATGEKDGHFDTVTARSIWVMNDAGGMVISLGANNDGNGVVLTYSAKGKDVVTLERRVDGEGSVTTYGPNGKPQVFSIVSADALGHGIADV